MKQFKTVISGLMMVLLCGIAQGSATRVIPWRVPSYTLTARSMPVRQALETFGVAEGIPVLLSQNVGGVVSGNFKDVPAEEFLDKISTINNLTWYYDGSTIYIYASSEVISILTDLKYMKAGEVCKLLSEFGVEDARFPIKPAANGELIMVSGPPRYVELVAELIARADKLREMRTFNEVETRIFPLFNTWAETVTFSVSSSETTLPIEGMATILKEIMQSSDSTMRDAGRTNSLTATERLQDQMGAKFTPIIKADNRLNAVIVRDVKTRMPTYERLIRQLDVPQKIIEIDITTLEMTKSDAMDWQLSLSLAGSRGRQSGGVGSNVDNLMTPDSLEGLGGSGAYSYLGKEVDVNASLRILQEKNKARSISRTSVLTVNNLAAELSDSQSYHARLVGEKVASLEEVTAGTELQIKPRIMDAANTNTSPRVWLSMQLSDGGFTSVSVDSMPMTRTTTLTTQAAVPADESLLLAGYFRDVTSDGGWGIPYLRDIPWIGWLFGGFSVSKEQVQRLFILTPHIIDLAYYSATSQDVTTAIMLRQRDISQFEQLEDEADSSDAARVNREERIEEKRDIRHEKDDETLYRERKERAFNREVRKDVQDVSRKVWREQFDARKEEYEKSKK